MLSQSISAYARRPFLLLLIFAVDTHHVVHWISPQYTRSEDNPVSTELPSTKPATFSQPGNSRNCTTSPCSLRPGAFHERIVGGDGVEVDRSQRPDRLDPQDAVVFYESMRQWRQGGRLPGRTAEHAKWERTCLSRSFQHEWPFCQDVQPRVDDDRRIGRSN